MKRTLVTVFMISAIVMLGSIAFAEEVDLTGVYQDGNADYYLDRSDVYENEDYFLNRRIRLGKKRGYYQELSDDFINQHIDVLKEYYRLQRDNTFAENDLLIHAIEFTLPLEMELLRTHQFEQYLDKNQNKYEHEDLNKLYTLNDKYDETQIQLNRYFDNNSAELEEIFDYVLESDGKDFKYNHYVLKYRIDDHLPAGEKIFDYQYDRESEIDVYEEEGEVITNVITDNDYIILKNTSSEEIDLTGMYLISSNADLVLNDVILLAGEDIIIGSSTEYKVEIIWDNADWSNKKNINLIGNSDIVIEYE